MLATLLLISVLVETDQRAADAAARSWLEENTVRLGMEAADAGHLRIRDLYRTGHNGVTHLVYEQHWQGIAVAGTSLQVNIDRSGQVLSAHPRLIRGLSDQVRFDAVRLTPEGAIAVVSDHLGLSQPAPSAVRTAPSGPDRAGVIEGGGVSLTNIPFRLAYATDGRGLRLAWILSVQRPFDWLEYQIDAGDGRVLQRISWTDSDSYRVYPFPLPDRESSGATHELVIDPADPVASPFGWHDADGVDGAEFTGTRGNNVYAQEDLDGNNSGGTRPDGGAGLTFDIALASGSGIDEGDNVAASVVNLFYWNNIVHDVLHRYGFDEPAGNFQIHNFGRGGGEADRVIADTLDGGGINNANFATPPDGSPPRMQTFQFVVARLQVNSPSAIAGERFARVAEFGAELAAAGITGNLQLVDDQTASPTDACEALTGFVPGNIALIDRGNCEFGRKALNAEQAGASGAVIVNDDGDGIVRMGAGADGSMVSIPSLLIGRADGVVIRQALAGNPVQVSMTGFRRDSSYDHGIVVHEYGHGLSNRLTGGPSAVSCLENLEQMGEGTSDILALILTASATDAPADPRAFGAYATGHPGGLRRYPYSTDRTLNPRVFTDVATASRPHELGSVWAAMLWDLYWAMVDQYGFDPDLYAGSGGNNLMLQLLVDGLKLQPCAPTFTAARDALLTADQVNNGGANRCTIWQAFAGRGLGLSADSGDGDVVGDETPAFDTPVDCGFPVPTVDLSVTIDDGLLVVDRDQAYAYRISAENAGPADAFDVHLSHEPDAGLLDVQWLCVAEGDAACGQSAGEGSISELIDLPVGGLVTFNLAAQFAATPENLTVINTAMATPPVGLIELNPANNTASDLSGTETVFGDGMESPLSARAGDFQTVADE